MSDTPRTDAESEGWIGPVPDGVSVDFARQLERELAQTQDRYASALDDGLMKSTMYNKKCDELEQAQARSAELEKALRGVLSEADRDTDALIRAKFTTTVSPPIKYSKCPEPPMTNDELADEIEKRRGGSIEYLGKLLWSNSSRIIAALRRSQPSGEMVLVPREPTEDMIIAGRRFCATDSIFVINFYRAMLSAAEAEGRKG